jgi:predicted nicotinamide N-methyase
LADALDIMQQNVDLMKNESKVEMIVKELSWGPDKQQEYRDVNLVLLTDVLYNQSSHDLLLDTLDWILDNENSKALLTYKERNPDEREFFTKVTNRGLKCNRVIEKCDDLVCEVYWIEK